VGSVVNSRTIFNFGAASRLFVATALAQKVEQGRLRLNQPLLDILPRLPINDERARSITIEHVLTSSSGLPDVKDFSWERPEVDDAALQRYLAALPEVALRFAPGRGFAPSSLGFSLLARVLEVLDEAPFETVIHRSILAPLQMTRSTLLYAGEGTRSVAPHVVDASGMAMPVEPFPYNRPHAGSSTMFSCVDDMLRWIQVNLGEGALEGVRIMSAQSARNLRTARSVDIESKGFPTGVKPALGWYVLPRSGRQLVAQGSSSFGFAGLCLFCPEERFGLVAVANSSNPQGPDSLRSFALTAIDEGLLQGTR
jgi:CubicO group peptidase (beta-lactamase class C family)